MKVDLQATKFYSLIYLNENIIFINDHFIHTQTQTDKDARLQHVDTSKLFLNYSFLCNCILAQAQLLNVFSMRLIMLHSYVDTT